MAQPSQDSIPFAPTRDLLIPKLDIYTSGSTEGLAYGREVSQPQPPRSTPSSVPRTSTPAYTARLGHRSLPTTPVPPAIPMSQTSINHSSTGPAAMPPSRSNRAPYFSGQVGDPIEDFLSENEELANNRRVRRLIRCSDYDRVTFGLMPVYCTLSACGFVFSSSLLILGLEDESDTTRHLGILKGLSRSNT
jgi:hypothetical protein